MLRKILHGRCLEFHNRFKPFMLVKFSLKLRRLIPVGILVGIPPGSSGMNSKSLSLRGNKLCHKNVETCRLKICMPDLQHFCQLLSRPTWKVQVVYASCKFFILKRQSHEILDPRFFSPIKSPYVTDYQPKIFSNSVSISPRYREFVPTPRYVA
jgi:hypothetical protein